MCLTLTKLSRLGLLDFPFWINFLSIYQHIFSMGHIAKCHAGLNNE